MPLGEVDIRPVSSRKLLEVLQQLPEVGRAPELPAGSVAAVVVHTDPYGQPYLDGPRRPLSAQIRHLTRTAPAATQDTSAVGWSILLACAHARMQHHDLHRAAFTEKWPGLEFLRTTHTDTGRQPRRDPAAELDRQWAKAVAAASLRPRGTTCNTSPARRDAEHTVAALLERMNAAPERWAGKTGAQDRLLLLALAARVLAAAASRVQLSERDWALAAGLTREAVADRLPGLREQGWLRRHQRAAGPWAAIWGPGEPGGGEHRSGSVFSPKLEARLTSELEMARADIWHARQIGILGQRVWKVLVEAGPLPVGELAARVGICAATVRSKLRALTAVGLCTTDGRGYRGKGRLERAATSAGVDGAHTDRMRLYRLQSAVFVWWFTTRYQPDNSDALGEWGTFPTPAEAEQTHPVDIALAYGATATGPPVEATTWGAAMAAQDSYREADPASWWELVAAARAELPAADVLAAPHQWATAA